jgi:hypothetical protein
MLTTSCVSVPHESAVSASGPIKRISVYTFVHPSTPLSFCVSASQSLSVRVSPLVSLSLFLSRYPLLSLSLSLCASLSVSSLSFCICLAERSDPPYLSLSFLAISVFLSILNIFLKEHFLFLITTLKFEKGKHLKDA